VHNLFYLFSVGDVNPHGSSSTASDDNEEDMALWLDTDNPSCSQITALEDKGFINKDTTWAHNHYSSLSSLEPVFKRQELGQATSAKEVGVEEVEEAAHMIDAVLLECQSSKRDGLEGVGPPAEVVCKQQQAKQAATELPQVIKVLLSNDSCLVIMIT
jgi:hypothetical protein